MATTPNYDLNYPVLTDPDNPPADIQNLAEDIEGWFNTVNLAAQPIWDGSNTVLLTAGTGPNAPDMRLTGSAQTVIVSSTFALTRDQYVIIGAKARLDNVGSATGGVGLHIAVDGTVVPQLEAGPFNVDIVSSGTAGLGRLPVTLGNYPVFMSAGTHTVDFRADRDSTGQIDAKASAGLSTGPTYRPTSLTIIV